MAKPKTLAVIDKYLQCLRRAIAKYEQPAVKGIVFQQLVAQPGQAVNPAAKIDRLDGRHNPHLRRDLDHGCQFHKPWLSAARSGAAMPFNSIRIFAPLPASSSRRHSQELLGEKGPNSTKRGSLSNFSTLAAGSRVRRLLSLLELTRNTWAVREIPKVSATLAADAHSVSGIRARPPRVARHRSNRRRTASSRAGRLSVCLVPIGHPPQCSVSAGYDTTTVKMIHARLPQGHYRGGLVVCTTAAVVVGVLTRIFASLGVAVAAGIIVALVLWFVGFIEYGE
jgi:hypothetical protein